MEHILATVKQAALVTLGGLVGGIAGILVSTLLSLFVWVISYLGAMLSSSEEITNEPLPFVAALAMCTIGGVAIGMITGVIFSFKKVVR